MNKICLTLEEFKELVKKEYLDPKWVVPEEEQLKYFNGDEAQETIEREYQDIVEDFNDGQFDLDFLKEDGIARVANLLYLMFEWV